MSKIYSKILEMDENVSVTYVRMKNVRKWTKKCKNVRNIFGIKIYVDLNMLMSMSISWFWNSEFLSDISVYFHHGNFPTFLPPLSDIFTHGSIFRHFFTPGTKKYRIFKIWFDIFTYDFLTRSHPPCPFTSAPMPVRICTNPIISQNSILFLYVI